jgi:hypothetical protein
MAITDAVISLLKEGHEDFELANQGSINKYLGLLTRDMDTNTFKMSQPFLICRILDFLLLDKNKTKQNKTKQNKTKQNKTKQNKRTSHSVQKALLKCDLDGVPQKNMWLYCGGAGMLTYLAKSV